MSDINKKIKDASVLCQKITNDLGSLHALLSSVSYEIDGNFKDQFRERKGDFGGLEDFYMLNTTLKKNAMTAKNALMLLKRMQNMDKFNVSDEALVDAELGEIFK